MYDGGTTEDKLIGSFCGAKIPDPIVSSSNKVLIVFKSDWSLTRGGFKLRFELGKLSIWHCNKRTYDK